MFCEQCGTEMSDDTLFCPNCGAKVSSDGTGYEDDDKTVILHEEPDFRKEEQQEGNSDAVETPEAAETEAEETKTAEHVETAAPDTGTAEVKEASDTVAETAETTETTGTGAETVETIEISPTGVVETGTAVAVPEEVRQKKFCPNCGAANGMNDLFCQQCGMFFGNPAEKMGDQAAPGKVRKGKNVWKIAAVAAAVLAVIGLGVVFVPRILGGVTAKDKDLDFVMYLKDNELTMARKNKYEPIVIGDRVFDDRDDSTSVYNYINIQYSSDHQYVFYPQKKDDDGYDLYRKKLGSKKAEEVKIDSGIVRYEVIDNDRLVYIKDSTDRKLYLYHKGESEKIASGAAWDLRVSADGKYIMWRDEDNRLYVQDTGLKSDKVKLESDVSVIYAVSDNFNKIVYQKEDKLYVMQGMEEKEKIASDVFTANVYDIDHSLKIYYLKEGNEESLSYYDLIEDDCLAQDQQITEPRIEDYQRVVYKDSFWGMQETVEVSDSYYEELEKYQQKQQRDYLRSSLENSSLWMVEYDIYYYEYSKGDSNKVMTALMQQGETAYGSVATNTALMYIDNVDREKIEGPSLSKLANIDYSEIQQKVTSALKEGRQLLYIENGEVHEIEDYEAGGDSYDSFLNIGANEDKHILYISDYDGADNRLYSYNYGQKNASLELITDELMRVVSYGTDEICYINTDEELYYGDTMIAEDCNGPSRVCENGVILYLTDMDKNGEEGTLHLYQNGRDTEIADDVAPIGDYGMFDSNKVFFLTDYNFKKYRGDLNVYDGKNVKKIDSDVTRIIY